MAYKILLIEDHQIIIDAITTSFSTDDFLLTIATDGLQAIEVFAKQKFDLILLDLGLPVLSGETVLRHIRKKSSVPIIVISIKNSVTKKTSCLRMGADDYMTKPIAMIELIERIKTVMRRSNRNEFLILKGSLRIHDLVIDLDNYLVHKNNQLIKLTFKEYEILKLLMTNPDKVFSKNEIFQLIWNQKNYDRNNSVVVHIKNLRSKIGDNNINPQYIISIRGFGYKLAHEVVHA